MLGQVVQLSPSQENHSELHVGKSKVMDFLVAEVTLVVPCVASVEQLQGVESNKNGSWLQGLESYIVNKKFQGITQIIIVVKDGGRIMVVKIVLEN